MNLFRCLSILQTSIFYRKLKEVDIKTASRAVFSLVVLAAIITFIVFSFITPMPVYILDNIGLRKYFLPDLTCKGCNNFTTKFVIENENFCKNANGEYEEIGLLILVASYHPNVNARQAIRKAWGSVKEYDGQKIRTLFIFGTHNDKNFNSQIQFEMDNYGDVIRADFADRYRTLTNKTVIGLQWVLKYCPKAKYVLKTDDDAFNIPQRYIDYLGGTHLDMFIGGYCFTITPDRSPSSKFYTSYEEYPQRYYPTYCSGPGYILSRPAIVGILSVVNDVKYLHMEDVFVAGVCRTEAHIEYTQIPGTVIWQGYFDKCAVTTWVKNSHNVLPEQQIKLWEDVVLTADNLRDCSSTYTKSTIFVCIFILIWCRILYVLFKKR